jgi:tyrosyl-tRNA synthetase
MEAKKRLATELVDRFCSQSGFIKMPQFDMNLTLNAPSLTGTKGEGVRAREEFEKVFSGNRLPDDIPTVEIAWDGEAMKLAKIIALAGAAKSNSEARRLIQQGAVEVNEKPIKDIDAELPVSGEYILRVGKKRFIKVWPKR